MKDPYIQLGGSSRKDCFQRSVLMKKGDAKSYNNFVKRFNNTDVYYSVFDYATKDMDTCLLYGPMFFDLDSLLDTEEAFKNIKRDVFLVISFLHYDLKVPEDYIEIYFSGAKGFHIMVSPIVFGAQPEEQLNIVYKTIALIANKSTITKPIDPKIYDRKRLFRITNSINGKTGLYKVPISIKTLRDLGLKSIREYASRPKEIIRPRPKSVNEARNKYYEILYMLYTAKRGKIKKADLVCFEEILPCVESILEEGVSEGERNCVSVGVASSLFQAGYDFDEAIQIMEEWDTRNTPPLAEEDPREIERTVKSAYKMFCGERYYGCSHFKDLGYCVDDCFLNRRHV